MNRNNIILIIVIVFLTAIIAGGVTYYLVDKNVTQVTVEGLRQLANLEALEYTATAFKSETYKKDINLLVYKTQITTGTAAVFVEGTKRGKVDLNK